MMQPGRANVGTAVIAHGAEHSRLQIPKGHVIGKAANIDLGVVVAVRIAAVGDHVGSPEASHVGQRHWLVVQLQVLDRPGHAALAPGQDHEEPRAMPHQSAVRGQLTHGFRFSSNG
jgi:hypothetical protein